MFWATCSAGRCAGDARRRISRDHRAASRALPRRGAQDTDANGHGPDAALEDQRRPARSTRRDRPRSISWRAESRCPALTGSGRLHPKTPAMAFCMALRVQVAVAFPLLVRGGAS